MQDATPARADYDDSADPSAWFRMPAWNFAHRLDYTGIYTLCRRSVPWPGDLPAADSESPRCPTCSSILSSGAL